MPKSDKHPNGRHEAAFASWIRRNGYGPSEAVDFFLGQSDYVRDEFILLDDADKATATGTSEINLVGLTVDEALPKLDKALDNAAIAERSQLRVIHGFGQGILRRAVAEFLEGHPHVAKVNVASEGRGGVTVVELRE